MATPRTRGVTHRPWAKTTVAALAVAVSLVTGGCTEWFGDENTNPPEFEVIVFNNSEQPIYYAFEPAGVTEPSGRFETVLAGEQWALGIGTAAVGDAPGGCFQSHLWLLASRSGQTYRQGDIAEYADDLEVIRHFSPGECTDQEQITVTYDGKGP